MKVMLMHTNLNILLVLIIPTNLKFSIEVFWSPFNLESSTKGLTEFIDSPTELAEK